MGRARQTVERTQLGLALLRLRNAAQKSQLEAAEAIGRTAARLSQVENGKGSLRSQELEKLLDFYGAAKRDRDTLLALGRISRRRQFGHGYLDLLPESYQRLTDMLVATDAIRWYECGIIPGLIQSPEYVDALMRAADSAFPDAEIEERIAFRLERQQLVLGAPTPKNIDIVFTEDTLRHVVGGLKVMRSQLLHLLQLDEQHQNLNLRVILDAIPSSPALGGGLILLGVSSPIGFASPLYGSAVYYDDPKDTGSMRQIFDRVQELALSTVDTRKLLVDTLRKDLE